MVSWLPHVTSACCCLGLQAGARLVGCLHLLVALTLVVTCAYFAAQFSALSESEDEAEPVYSAWYKISLAVSAVSTAHVVLAGTLLYGVAKKHCGALRTWVVVMGCLVCGALLYVLVVTAVHGLDGAGSEIFLTFSEGLVFFCVIIYCIICVNSFYMLVKSAEDMEGPKYF